MLTCNINARGKAVRLVMGCLGVLMALGILALIGSGLWTDYLAWALAASLLVAGGFMIFEGAAGWCVLRALGLRTFI